MRVLIAVIEDLLLFARTALFGAVVYAPSPDNSIDVFQEKIETAASRLENKPKVPAMPSVEIDALHVGSQCFIGETDVDLYEDPATVFDTVQMSVSYGQQVRLLKLQGRWAQVRFAHDSGWLLKDSLRMFIDDVYPKFQQGISYYAEHPQTRKLRAVIGDMFSGEKGGHPLSAAEYVQYKLTQVNRVIPWGSARARVPGTWQRRLKGVLGVHIGISPKTSCAMEYINDDIGHLAFVEAVFPDGSIKITEIGKLDDASYTEDTLAPEQWRELGPVFIAIA